MSTLEKEGQVLVEPCWIADSFWSRFKGLMGKKQIEDAICFPNCNSIHTFFMRFPIDVVMVNKEGKVVRLIEGLQPWRLVAPNFKVKHVVEMAARRCRELGIEEGTQLSCEGGWR